MLKFNIKTYRTAAYLTFLLLISLLYQNCSSFQAAEYDSNLSENGIFLNQPGSRIVFHGAPVNNEVKVSLAALGGPAPSELTYQWFFRSELGADNQSFSLIENITGPSLDIPVFRVADQGDYKLVVSHNEIEYETRAFNLRLRNATNTCDASELSFEWPLQGQYPTNWYISNYFDSNLSAMLESDYTGAKGRSAITYDGHRGIDIALPASFQSMDLGVPVYASESGEVILVRDGEFDRSKTRNMGAVSNMVVVRSNNGFTTGYFHLKTDSISVKKNDLVNKGQLIGMVGSSGDSDGPHLHIEARDCDGISFDLMEGQIFSVKPEYKPQRALLDLRLSLSVLDSEDHANHYMGGSPPNITEAPVNTKVYITRRYAYLGHGENIDIVIRNNTNNAEVLRINGLTNDNSTSDLTYRSYITWGDWFSIQNPGSYRIELTHEGQVLGSNNIQIVSL